MHDHGVRTTIEITDEQRAELLRMAGERGEKGFSRIIQQAIEEYLRGRQAARERTKAALAVLGTLSEASAARLKENVRELRSHWR
jgi:metal-responsive CopG/Arc/MetJ family transcriptional regulator